MEPLKVTHGAAGFTEHLFECHCSGVPEFIALDITHHLLKMQESIIRQNFSRHTLPLSNLISYVLLTKSSIGVQNFP